MNEPGQSMNGLHMKGGQFYEPPILFPLFLREQDARSVFRSTSVIIRYARRRALCKGPMAEALGPFLRSRMFLSQVKFSMCFPTFTIASGQDKWPLIFLMAASIQPMCASIIWLVLSHVRNAASGDIATINSRPWIAVAHFAHAAEHKRDQQV